MLLREPDAPAIRRTLDTFEEVTGSRLLGVELRRVALRGGDEHAAEDLLDEIDLTPLDEAILGAAERLIPANVGTLDAIHLVTALRLAEAGILDTILTYDARLAEAARHHGLTVLSPS